MTQEAFKFEGRLDLNVIRPQADVLCEGQGRVQKLTGMAGWFCLSCQVSMPAPAHYKMAILSWFAAFPKIQILNGVVAPRLSAIPILLEGAIIDALMIVLMTYAAMPMMAKGSKG